MSKRRLITFSVALTCLVIILCGFFYWYSDQLAEQRLEDYIKRIEDLGFTIQERSLADFQVDGKVRIHYFGDFRSFAEQEGIKHIYLDRGIHALYFLNPVDDKIEANILYYK